MRPEQRFHLGLIFHILKANPLWIAALWGLLHHPSPPLEALRCSGKTGTGLTLLCYRHWDRNTWYRLHLCMIDILVRKCQVYSEVSPSRPCIRGITSCMFFLWFCSLFIPVKMLFAIKGRLCPWSLLSFLLLCLPLCSMVSVNSLWFDTHIHQPLLFHLHVTSQSACWSVYLINLNFNTLPLFTISRFCPFSGASNLLFTLGLKIRIISYLPLSATFNLFQSLVPSSSAIFYELVSSSPAPSMFPPWLSYFCLVTGPNLLFRFSLSWFPCIKLLKLDRASWDSLSGPPLPPSFCFLSLLPFSKMPMSPHAAGPFKIPFQLQVSH